MAPCARPHVSSQLGHCGPGLRWGQHNAHRAIGGKPGRVLVQVNAVVAVVEGFHPEVSDLHIPGRAIGRPKLHQQVLLEALHPIHKEIGRAPHKGGGALQRGFQRFGPQVIVGVRVQADDAGRLAAGPSPRC